MVNVHVVFELLAGSYALLIGQACGNHSYLQLYLTPRAMAAAAGELNVQSVAMPTVVRCDAGNAAFEV